MNEIYLAGGCFWGVEKFVGKINGVTKTEVGYAQSNIENPTYEDVCNARSTASEVVKVVYNDGCLEKILEKFFLVIDPTSLNKQGPDRGMQYRTGIYCTTKLQEDVAKKFIDLVQKNYNLPIVVEVEPLKNYTRAEEYHQDYLTKNVNGYCHINFANFTDEDFE